MILDKEKRIAIFLNPKTGTTTLLEVFKKESFSVYDHGHENLNEAESKYGSLEMYRKFCFYRDPLDRARSILRQMPHLPPKLYLERLFAESKQIHWLDHSNILYFNFHNFTAELRRLSVLLGISIADIPITNSSLENFERDKILLDNTELIKDFYQEDYRFFKEQNLLF